MVELVLGKIICGIRNGSSLAYLPLVMHNLCTLGLSISTAAVILTHPEITKARLQGIIGSAFW